MFSSLYIVCAAFQELLAPFTAEVFTSSTFVLLELGCIQVIWYAYVLRIGA